MRARAWLTLERVAVLLLVGLAASARGDVVSTQPGGGGVSVGANNTWTGNNTWSTGTATFSNTPTFQTGMTVSAGFNVALAGVAGVGYFTQQTPDGPFFGADALANSFLLGRINDRTFDFNNGACAGAACTNPHFIIEPSVQSTTQYAGHMSAGTEYRQSKALTESAATTFVQIPVANLQAGATGGTVDYTISASDGTDTQARHGRTIFQAIAKAGTVTCTIAPTTETTDGSTIAASLGTLTYTLTCATGSNLINIQANAVSSLTQTSLNIDYAVTLSGAGEIKPQ